MRMLGLSLLALLLMSSLAAAQPALTASSAPPAAPSTYLEVGVAAGVVGEDLAVGAAFGAGLQLAGSPLWLHGELAHDDTAAFLVDRGGTTDQARAGLEARTCVVHGNLCGVAGLDLALQHTRETGTGVNVFEVGPSDPVMTTEETTTLGIARIGIDLGGKHLRYRPSFELAFDRAGLHGGALVHSLAWQF